MSKRRAEITVKPHELVEVVARLGAGRDPSNLGDERLNVIIKTLMEEPRTRLRFRLYQGERYNGSDENAPGGVLPISEHTCADCLYWQHDRKRCRNPQ